MMIHDITAQAGRRKRRKRVGRGESSGLGKTCGRGNKGMQSRAGNGPHPLHIGGATPLYRRAPKRGFSNAIFRREYQVVNLDDLQRRYAAGERVDRASLYKHRLIADADGLVKVLGRGELTHPLTLEVHAVSAAARQAVEKAGGSVQILPLRDAAALARARRKSARGKPRPAGPTRLEKKKQRAASA